MSRRTLRLVVIPGLLFASVVGLTFGLANDPLAKPEPTAAASGTGDRVRGEELYAEHCSSCHGDSGRNASVGPDLAGNPISVEEARAQIETGSGVMPADLVSGQELEDVLAYLETIFAGEPLRESD
jgi:mono/diheme cytochrome c family protein